MTPGFTAEASLSDFSSYATPPASTAGTNRVVPQVPISCFVKAISKQQGCIRDTRKPLYCQALFVADLENCR
jgi:hypothetical protein